VTGWEILNLEELLSLLALEPVTVRVTANKDLVHVGEDVEVRCDVAGDASPFIRWHKVGGSMGTNVKIRENTLRVSSVMPDNGGMYRCVATTRSGIYEDDYALTIQGKLPLLEEAILQCCFICGLVPIIYIFL